MVDKSENKKVDQVELVRNQNTSVLSKEDVTDPIFDHPNEIESIDINERKTLRKIDLRVVPMVTLLYLLSFLDRGYANIHSLAERALLMLIQECRQCQSTWNGKFNRCCWYN